MSQKQPLPCPFCGGHPELYNTREGSTVECVTPECWVQPSVSLIFDPTQKDLPTAMEAWNRRTPDLESLIPEFTAEYDGGESQCDIEYAFEKFIEFINTRKP